MSPDLRHRVRTRYVRTRAAAGRFLRRAPLPEWLRAALRRAGAWLPVPAPGGAVPGPHPAVTDDPDYAAWLSQHTLDAAAGEAARARLGSLRVRPLISVVMPVRDPHPNHLRIALGSVEAQIYPGWEFCIADDASTSPAIGALLEGYAARNPRVCLVRLSRQGHIAVATNAAIALARGDFLAFLDHDDELTPDALLEVAALLQDDPGADLIYSDHDILGEDGLLRSPRFKPDWSPELLLSCMYFGHLKVYRTALVREVGGMRAGFEGSTDYDLALRLVERTDHVRHIPRLLYHWRAAPASMARTSQTKPYSFETGRRAVEEALRRRGIAGAAEQPEWAQQAGLGAYKIRFHGTDDVPVTIVIPTRDRARLLRNCIESIEQKTAHRAYEILILDNDSREPETLEYLRRSPYRVVPFSGLFNFAAMVNRGVAEARTEYFVLLNNDTLVIAPGWLDELLGYGQLPGVGAVGAKLLYPDGRIQHAGVILGIHGLTGHAFQPRLDTVAPLEYECYAHVARNYLAVTAACLLSHKTAFAEVGGFNDRDLQIAWNDVDYCLRLREKGYRVVFNPYALLSHLESQSRGDDKNPAEVRYMMEHWREYIDRDPFYSPHLSRRDSEFRIKTDADEAQFFYYR
jgi:O-antigen biosynthesis protein